MRVTRKVREILSWYESDTPGTKANLARILMNGRLGGSGKVLILPVDQGFEHGPARSFAANPPAYDPHYHFQLAIDAGVDFPSLLIALHRGETIVPPSPRIGVRCRWLLGDLDHLLISLRRRQAREAREDMGYGFFVFGRADDSLMGGVTLSNLQRGIALSCGLGYWIGEPYARQGLMTEAVRSVLPFVFETLALHRLEAACLPGNEASKRLLRKLGFGEEGYARGYLRIDAEWHDHLLFAMLSSDYFADSR